MNNNQRPTTQANNPQPGKPGFQATFAPPPNTGFPQNTFGQPQGAGFGQPPNTGFVPPPNTGFQNTAFVQPPNTNTAFGQPLNKNTVFGQPPNTNTAFVQPPNTNTAFVQPPNTNTVFGQPPNTNTVFGQPPNTNTVFGQPSNPSFGQSPNTVFPSNPEKQPVTPPLIGFPPGKVGLPNTPGTGVPNTTGGFHPQGVFSLNEQSRNTQAFNLIQKPSPAQNVDNNATNNIQKQIEQEDSAYIQRIQQVLKQRKDRENNRLEWYKKQAAQ